MHFLARRHPAADLPNSGEKLEAWCRDIWRRKEATLEQFYERDRSFAINGLQPAVTPAKEAWVQRVLWLSVAFWLVFLMGVINALVFLPLFRWYCLLSALTYAVLSKFLGGMDGMIYSASGTDET